MLELIQITNDPAFARRCDALPGFRLFVDLERIGKAERQAGRNTFISAHQLDDVGNIKRVLQRSPLMVRVNPLHDGTPAEVEAALRQGADRLMLPMFTRASEVREFTQFVAGRAPVTLLLETAGALACLDEWIATPGLNEVYVGLNDLHLSMGHRFMFEPLAQGWVERVATAAQRQHLRFGFGGIARLDEGLLPGRDVLAALGSQLRGWLPWRSMAISLSCLLVLAGIAAQVPGGSWGLWSGLALAALAGLLVMGATWWGSADLRAALAR